jgi:hypothetical protein
MNLLGRVALSDELQNVTGLAKSIGTKTVKTGL